MQILKFKSNPKVTRQQLTDNGFVPYADKYRCEKDLYENLIKLIVEYTYEETPILNYNVTNSAGDTYLPFSTQEFDNNVVAKEVINLFNHTMKDFVRAGIVLDDYEKKDGKGIKIKYHADIDKIEQKDGGDWIDLRSAEDVELKAGEHRLIHLGVSMRLPKGYEAIVAPRSSSFKHYGILMTNSIGVIDGAYCGDDDEWLMSVYATRDTSIKKNDRICQFRIVKNQPKVYFDEVNTLNRKSRGGFGSTGVQ